MGTNTTGLPTNTAPLTQQELKNQPDFLSNGVLRAHVIRAECCLLIAMVYLSQETVIGYLKAGLNLRRGNVWPTCYCITCTVLNFIQLTVATAWFGKNISGWARNSIDIWIKTLFPRFNSGKRCKQEERGITMLNLRYSIGSVHLLLSSLPAKILRIISAFGWKADKQLGFALLKLCMCSKRIRSSLASIM